MKKIINTITILSFLVCITIPMSLLSQDAPPPPPGSGHGAEGNQSGGRAPIGSGIFILLTMGGSYAGFKLYKKRKRSLLD